MELWIHTSEVDKLGGGESQGKEEREGGQGRWKRAALYVWKEEDKVSLLGVESCPTGPPLPLHFHCSMLSLQTSCSLCLSLSLSCTWGRQQSPFLFWGKLWKKTLGFAPKIKPFVLFCFFLVWNFEQALKPYWNLKLRAIILRGLNESKPNIAFDFPTFGLSTRIIINKMINSNNIFGGLGVKQSDSKLFKINQLSFKPI